MNKDKRKSMLLSRRRGGVEWNRLNEIEFVDQFKYLGALVTYQNSISKEIEARITEKNRALYILWKAFQSKALSIPTNSERNLLNSSEYSCYILGRVIDRKISMTRSTRRLMKVHNGGLVGIDSWNS